MKALLFIFMSCYVYSDGMEVFFKNPRNIGMKQKILDFLPEENMNAVSRCFVLYFDYPGCYAYALFAVKSLMWACI